ncbi:MAG TPA: hypothetical protein VMS38_34510 [Pseudorhodoferax sp.]|nr:hypothetical protein [Pseudorhodoferax sp.]
MSVPRHRSRTGLAWPAWLQRASRLGGVLAALAWAPAAVWPQGTPPGMVPGAGAAGTAGGSGAGTGTAPAPVPPAAGASPAERALQGVWTWEYQPEGGALQRFLLERRADGTFTLLSRSYAAGRASTELLNAGLWGVSNGLYFTVTTEVNGQRVNVRDSALYNPYVIVGLQGDVLRYRHLPTGIELRTRKVPATTRLPD